MGALGAPWGPLGAPWGPQGGPLAKMQKKNGGEAEKKMLFFEKTAFFFLVDFQLDFGNFSKISEWRPENSLAPRVATMSRPLAPRSRPCRDLGRPWAPLGRPWAPKGRPWTKKDPPYQGVGQFFFFTATRSVAVDACCASVRVAPYS